MTIFTLSSSGERYNNKFSNYYADAIQIEPNSYIALINASFIRHDTAGNFRVVAGENTFNVKVSAYDISIALTVPPAQYTLETLADAITSAALAISPIWKIQAYARDDPGKGDIIAIGFYRKPAAEGGQYGGYYDYGDTIGAGRGSKVAFFYPINVVAGGYTGNNLTTAPVAASINGQTAIDAIAKPAGVTQAFFGAGMGPVSPTAGFYPYNANQHASGGFEMARYNGCFTMTIMSPNAVFDWEVGQGLYSGPAGGAAGFYTAPDRIQDLALFRAVSEAGSVDFKVGVRNIQTNLMVDTAGAYPYGPGTTLHISMETTMGEENFQPKLTIFTQPNYTCWSVPFDIPITEAVGTWRTFAAGVAGPTAGTYQVSDIDFNTYMGVDAASRMGPVTWVSTDLWKGQIGCYAGTGTTFRNPQLFIQTHALAAGSNGTATAMPRGGNLQLQRQNSLGTIFYNSLVDLDFRNDYTTGSQPSYPIRTVAPHLISMGFIPIDDNGSAAHVLFGGRRAMGDPTPLLLVNVGLAPGNISVYDDSGVAVTLLQSAFVKPDGTAFTGFVYGNTYLIGLATGGTADTEVKVYIAENNWTSAADTFTGIFTMTTGLLPQMKFIGGYEYPDVNPAATDRRYNGSIFDFNVCSISTGDTRVPAKWLNQFDERCAGSIVGGVFNQNADWYNVPTNVDVVNPAVPENVIPQATNAHELGHYIFDESGVTNAAADQWFEWGNFNFTPIHDLYSTKRNDSAPAICFEPDADAAEIGIVNDSATTSFMKNIEIVTAGEDRATMAYIDLTTRSLDEAAWIAEIEGDRTPEEATDISHIMNVCVDNLTQRCYNGANKNITKSIYQVPFYQVIHADGSNEIIHYEVPQKVWIPLHNPSTMTLNQLDIRITDEADKLEQNLAGPTNIFLQIEDNKSFM